MAKRLADGRKRKHYPHKVVARFSGKQMEYLKILSKMHGSVECLLYYAALNHVHEMWRTISDEDKKRILEMEH